MPITQSASGTTFTGHAVTIFRYKSFIIALRMAQRAPGLKMTRGPSTLSRAKKITGLHTHNIDAHIDWFTTQIAELEVLDGSAE